MSEASSAVTYTSVYTDSEPGRVFWGTDEELSDGGSPRVIVHGYDGLPMMPPHDPDFVPEPIYPEYIPLEDEHILPAEEQPLPLAESPGYVDESDPEEDPEEYEEDETEDGPVGYPMDGGDDGDNDDIDSSGYDADNEDEDEEEEEYLALADSTSISLPPEAEVKRLLAMPTPSPSPLTSISPPSAGERLARCTAPAALPSPPLSPSLYPPLPVDRRDGIPESEQPPRKRLCLATLGSRYEDLYALLEDAQDGRTRISQQVAMDSQRVDLLMGDRMTLKETVWIVEEEAYAAREAWAQLVGLNQTTHHEFQTLQEQVYAKEYQLQAHKAQLQLQSTLI
nr:hypothetical protein [Tanacetum cinerariifolium]